MPTIQITVCARCGKKSCDGGLWKWVKVTRLSDGVETPLSKIPVKNQTGCTLDFGVSNRKHLVGQPVGTEVDLTFPRWIGPSVLRIRKIED